MLTKYEIQARDTTTQRRMRDRRAKTIEENYHAVEHGLYSTYVNWSCRCWKCTTANWVYCTLMNDKRKGLW